MNLLRKLKRLIPALFLLAVPAFAQNPTQFSSIGTISATAGSCAPNLNNSAGCVILPLQKNIGSAAISVLGAFTGTLQFEVTVNGNTTSLGANPSTGGAQVTNATAPGNFTVPLQGASSVQVRASALSSGTPLITIQSSTAPVPFIAGSVPLATGAYATQSAAGVLAGSAGRLDCSQFAGADMSIKVNACIAALGTGVADASNFRGAQTWSVGTTVPTKVTLLFGPNVQISQAANITATAANSAIVCPADKSAVFTKAANIDQFTTNGYIGFCTVVGASPTFTGVGINNSGGTVEFNNVSSEAGDGINSTGGIVQYNVVSGTSASGHPIHVSSGQVVYNSVTGTVSDGIYVTSSSSTLVAFNSVGLNPSASTSGLCGINFNADQLGDREETNFIQIVDSTNSGNVDYGVCDTPTGTHNLNMLFSGTNFIGILSGSVTAYGYRLNNAAGLNTNWVVQFENFACVHITACFQGVDSVGNLTVVMNPQPGDDPIFDGTTTDTGIRYIDDINTYSFANLSTLGASGVVANGSRVGFCSNCTGRTVTSGGPGTQIQRIAGRWVGTNAPSWAFVQNVPQHNAGASSTTSTFANNNGPGNIIVLGVQCTTASGTPTLTLSDSRGNNYLSAIGPFSDGANNWIQLFYAANIVGGASGNVISAASSVNVCTSINITGGAEYSGVATVSPLDGAGISTAGNSGVIASGSFAVTGGDLVVSEVESKLGLINPGTGIGAGWVGRPGSGDFVSIYQDQIGANAGTANSTAGPNASDPWAVIAIAFKLAP